MQVTARVNTVNIHEGLGLDNMGRLWQDLRPKGNHGMTQVVNGNIHVDTGIDTVCEPVQDPQARLDTTQGLMSTAYRYTGIITRGY